MCLGAGTEDAESTEIKIEEIGTGIDAAQSTIEFEVVTLISLFESSGENYLEYITAHTMHDTLADVLTVLVVGERTGAFSHGMEVKGTYHGGVVDQTFQLGEVAFIAFRQQLHDDQFVAEMVEDDGIPVELIEDIGCIIL